MLRRKANFGLGILLLLPATAAVAAGECPPPPRLTCEQLLEKAEQRCPPSLKPSAAAAAAGTAAKPKTEVRYIIQDAPPPKAVGAWMVGAGPVWLNNWGAQAVAGYRFASGWQLQAGPMWVPQHASTGTVPVCPGAGPGGDHPPVPGRCFATPFTVEAKQAWGGSALVSYVFK